MGIGLSVGGYRVALVVNLRVLSALRYLTLDFSFDRARTLSLALMLSEIFLFD